MPTYLLAWNPKRYDWTALPELALRTAGGAPVVLQWSCGGRRGIFRGDRVFLVHLGREPRGLVGAGVVESDEPYPAPHWEPARAARGDQPLRVDVRFERLLDPNADEVLPLATLRAAAPDVRWSTQRSGIGIPDADAATVERLWQTHLGRLPIDDGLSDVGKERFPEGREVYRLHRERERNPDLVRLAKERALRRHGRLACEVPGCGFDFAERYGEAGDGYIECHHTTPLYERGERATRLDEVALVCANCHRMLHWRRPWLSVEQLGELLIR